jgi:hypothetical protein
MGAILHWNSREFTEQVNAYKTEIAMRHAYEKKERAQTRTQAITKAASSE